MTFCMYMASYLFRKKMKVVKILGTMLTFKTRPEGQLSDNKFSIATGIVAHYLVGILFVIIYYLLWKNGIGKPDLIYGAIFGFASGLFGILIWHLFFLIHPKPPANIHLKDYFIMLVVAHIVFGIIAAISFIVLGNYFNISF